MGKCYPWLFTIVFSMEAELKYLLFFGPCIMGGREEEKRFVSSDTWAAEVNLRVSCSFTIQSINQRLRCRHFRGKDRLSHLAGWHTYLPYKRLCILSRAFYAPTWFCSGASQQTFFSKIPKILSQKSETSKIYFTSVGNLPNWWVTAVTWRKPNIKVLLNVPTVKINSM